MTHHKPPVVAVVNQKGGVAKTTTVTHLAAACAEGGVSVLVVDLDPQASCTFSTGVDPDVVTASIAEVLHAGTPAHTVLHPAPGLMRPGSATVDLLAASAELSGTEATLADRPHREQVLADGLKEVIEHYQVVLLDCSPTLGLLTINALVAASHVLVPVSCDMLSHRGVGQLIDTVDDVRQLINPSLTISGILPTMFDSRSSHAQAVVADLPDRYGLPVLPAIPRSVRFAEAPAVGKTVLHTNPRSKGATAYREVAATLAASWGVPLNPVS